MRDSRKLRCRLPSPESPGGKEEYEIGEQDYHLVETSGKPKQDEESLLVVCKINISRYHHVSNKKIVLTMPAAMILSSKASYVYIKRDEKITCRSCARRTSLEIRGAVP